MFLVDPPEDDALRALYDDAQREDGYVMNLLRVWGWRPDVFDAFSQARSKLAAGTSLSKREIAVLNSVTAARFGDSYCSLAWGTRLANLSDAHTAAALLRRQDAPALSERERALAAWATAVVEHANGIACGDVDTLRDAGFNDREIFEATAFVAFRLAFNAVNDALGALPDRQLAHEAPPEVVASVTYGRDVDPGPGE